MSLPNEIVNIVVSSSPEPLRSTLTQDPRPLAADPAALLLLSLSDEVLGAIFEKCRTRDLLACEVRLPRGTLPSFLINCVPPAWRDAAFPTFHCPGAFPIPFLSKATCVRFRELLAFTFMPWTHLVWEGLPYGERGAGGAAAPLLYVSILRLLVESSTP